MDRIQQMMMRILDFLWRMENAWVVSRWSCQRDSASLAFVTFTAVAADDLQQIKCSQSRPLRDFSHSTREKKYYWWMTHISCSTFLFNSGDVLFSPTCCDSIAFHKLHLAVKATSPPFFNFAIFETFGGKGIRAVLTIFLVQTLVRHKFSAPICICKIFWWTIDPVYHSDEPIYQPLCIQFKLRKADMQGQ